MFVVEFLVCGERLGSRVGVLRRWRSSGSLEEVWGKAVSWSRGNCRREGVGFPVASGCVSGRFQVVERLVNVGGRRSGAG